MDAQLSHKGFTLIELLITIAVFVIVIGFAAPSFQSIIQNNRTINLTNDFIYSLNLARSEAIKRGSSVSICPASNQSFNSCGNNWNQGWLIFVNPDENNVFSNDAIEVLVRIQQIDTTTANITLTTGNAPVTFTSNGFANSTTGNMAFTLKATGCNGNHGRQIVISPTGRPVVSETSC